ncbi:MAG: hypothetical protein U1E05_23265, partial [Patescibacteria group bacterium]|nr:hypothetical protein [Patescibacteria group bacterium]
MPRITRIAVSFFAVATAYWLYALIAVPFIEPTTSRRAEGSAEFSDRRNGASRLDQRLASLAELFPADSWVLKNPKILESDQFQLLTQDYRNRGDGRLELRPCAIVVTPEGPAETEQQRRRRAIVLEAPEGAVLEFDRPLDLRRGSMGQIVGGQLQGRVIIRSQGESPGPEDDLLIVTRDVEMTRANVFTPHVVDFRFGPHHGRGRELRIKLLEGTADKGQPTPNVTGVELFELRKVERLHLQMGQMASAQAGASRAKSGGPPATSAAGALGDMADVPVEITCEGPFRFDVPGKVASFQDKVRVVRLNPNGRNDQLNCDQLAIYFEERAEAKGQATLLRDGKTLALTSAKKGKVSMDLVPQRLEATGKPVTMSAPNQGVEARGRLLRYNLINGQVLLEDDREAMLRQEANEIHAQRLVYQPDQSGRLGQMAAEGPGWLRGHSPERPDEPLEVSWKKEARVYPEKDQQVVKVDGSAWLRFRGIGQLDAETVLFRLNELPPDKGETQRRLQPDRMEAAQNVSIRSPQLDGAVDELTVVFEQQTPGAGIPWRPGGRPAGQSERTRTDSGRSVALAPAVFRQPSTIAPSGAVEADVTRPVHYVASAASPSAAALIAAAPSAASASVA